MSFKAVVTYSLFFKMYADLGSNITMLAYIELPYTTFPISQGSDLTTNQQVAQLNACNGVFMPICQHVGVLEFLIPTNIMCQTQLFGFVTHK